MAHGAGDVPAVPPPVPARDVRSQGCSGARLHPTAPVAAPAVPQVSAAPSSTPQLQGLSQQCHGAVPGPRPSPVLTSLCLLVSNTAQSRARARPNRIGNTSSLSPLFPPGLKAFDSSDRSGHY